MAAGSEPFYPGVDLIYRSLNLINTFTQRGRGPVLTTLCVTSSKDVPNSSCFSYLMAAGFTSLTSEVDTNSLE